MPTMLIYRDGYAGAKRFIKGCRDCGQKLFFCKTARGKWLPFDHVPEPIADDGRLETVSTAGVHMRTCSKRHG